jgi:hypothetical protein
LFEVLGLGRQPAAGTYESGTGRVIIDRVHPATYARSSADANRLRKLVRQGVEAAHGNYAPRNYLQLRRGPYVIAAVVDESISDEPLKLTGSFVDLLDPQLSVRNEVVLAPGQQAWLLDLNRVCAVRPLLLAAAGRVESWTSETGPLQYTISSPAEVQVTTRILLDQPPHTILVNGQPHSDFTWDETSKTLLVRHPGTTAGVQVVITFAS